MNKKGMEIAISLLVVLIITVVLFGMGIYMVRQMYGGATEIQEQLEKQTEREIERMIRQENALVAVPFGTKTARKGEKVVFGVGIRNTQNTDDEFTIVTQFSNAYTPDGKNYLLDAEAEYINEKWVAGFAKQPSFTVPGRAFTAQSIVIKADQKMNYAGTQTQPGRYTFIVCVYKGEPVDTIEKCSTETFKNSPGIYYSNKVYPVVIEIN